MREPITLALAPSATNTVEKPSTKRAAAATVSRLTRDFGSLSANRSSDVPARKTRYGGTNGSTQGDRKLTRPAARAARKVTSPFMSLSCDATCLLASAIRLFRRNVNGRDRVGAGRQYDAQSDYRYSGHPCGPRRRCQTRLRRHGGHL